MKTIRITIQTEPVAKGRPRVSFHNGKVRTYTPTKTLDAQEFIKARLLRHRDDCFPRDIPVKLTAVFYRTKSRWLPKKEILPHRKPDLSNFLKTLEDAINGVLVSDDAQLTAISIKKRWTNNTEGYINIKLEPDKP